MTVAFINKIIDFLAAAVVLVINLLPQSPFTWQLGALGPYMSFVNYFIPFAAISGVMATYVTAVLLWYAARWILRFSRYIS